MKHLLLFSFILFICTTSCKKHQNNVEEIISEYTANTRVPSFNGYFLYGSNMGWLNHNWQDEDVADLLIGNKSKDWEGVGVNSLRPALYENFVETWGYDVRVHTFKYYFNQGSKYNVVFIGDWPCDLHREKKQYVSGVRSESYENLYEPVWIETENGKKVNENNYYAMYVYQLVQRYKNWVKFWEIKNEPDFTASQCGWTAPGTACNWWDRDPSPDELYNFHAPVQSYIRMLRVSYEVIKSVDPEAYICVGGIGYASFLDAILRNTDNPDNGKITERYPFTGGAWFDCLSFHIYPMYYVSSGFRHSDAVVASVENQTAAHIELLKKYGYGGEFPAKEIIITETNIPSKQIGNSIGSEEAQRNYLMKVAIIGQKLNIRGIYPFGVWDNKEENEYGGEYDFMGFYRPLPNSPSDAQLRLHESGVGWRTTSRLLKERRYDANETQRLNLTSDMNGAAFYSETAQDYMYVLWAKTTSDLNEKASASYFFPVSMDVKEMTIFDWTEKQYLMSGNTVNLNETPLFIKVIKAK